MMRDVGYVTRGEARRQGLNRHRRCSWEKRYITLGPQASLVGLAFRLIDPENILGRGEEIGITGGVYLRPSSRRLLPEPCAIGRRSPWAELGRQRLHSYRLGDWRGEDGGPGLAHADGVPCCRTSYLAAVVVCGRREVFAAKHQRLHERILVPSLISRSARWRDLRSRSRAWARMLYVIEAARGVTVSMVSRRKQVIRWFRRS